MSFGLSEEQPGAGACWSFFSVQTPALLLTGSEAVGSDGSDSHLLCDIPSVSCSLATKGMYGSSMLLERQVAFGQDSRMFAGCF